MSSVLSLINGSAESRKAFMEAPMSAIFSMANLNVEEVAAAFSTSLKV